MLWNSSKDEHAGERADNAGVQDGAEGSEGGRGAKHERGQHDGEDDAVPVGEQLRDNPPMLSTP